MWPWEHLAVGYIAYSVWCRRQGRGRPAGLAVAVLAVATQLPDVVDKPLGWGTTLLPGGHSLAHSLFVALPLVGLVALLARRRGVAPLGTAFGVGYLSHLPGDVVYPLATGGEAAWRFLFWPLLSAQGSLTTDVFGRAGDLFAAFLAFLATPRGLVYLGFEVALLTVAVALWYGDGLPGVAACRGAVRSLRPR